MEFSDQAADLGADIHRCHGVDGAGGVDDLYDVALLDRRGEVLHGRVGGQAEGGESQHRTPGQSQNQSGAAVRLVKRLKFSKCTH